MESITLKEIAGYLPYKLQVLEIRTNAFRNLPDIEKIVEWQIKDVALLLDKKRYTLVSAKPIIYPLSMLTQEIEHNGEKFIPCNVLFPFDEFDEFIGQDAKTYAEGFIRSSNRLELCYPLSFWEKLYEWHFDLHRLIERNLAIDKSKI